MPRKIVPPSNLFPYHVTDRTNNKEFFKTDLNIIWDIYSDYLYFLKSAFDFNIHLFVLMSNHFHLVVDTPGANLSAGMAYFLRETSKVITRETASINHLYGGRFYRSLITTQPHYNNVYRYCYQNPVRAGISPNCQQYQFSTMAGLLGQRAFSIPLCEDPILFSSHIDEYLSWVNRMYDESDLSAIRQGLSQRVFKLPKTPARYSHPLNFLDAPSRRKEPGTLGDEMCRIDYSPRVTPP